MGFSSLKKYFFSVTVFFFTCADPAEHFKSALVDTSLPNILSKLPSTESKTPLLYLHGLSICFLEICLTFAFFFFAALTSEGPSGSLPNNLSIPRSKESKGPEKA